MDTGGCGGFDGLPDSPAVDEADQSDDPAGESGSRESGTRESGTPERNSAARYSIHRQAGSCWPATRRTRSSVQCHMARTGAGALKVRVRPGASAWIGRSGVGVGVGAGVGARVGAGESDVGEPDVEESGVESGAGESAVAARVVPPAADEASR